MKLVIVGGVAGGASAAARARRLDETAEIVVFERGPNVSFANCGLPYYIGGTIVDRNKLLVAPEEMLRQRFRLDIRTNSSVEAIDRAGKTVRVKNMATGQGYDEAYDKLILSPGAKPLRPPLPGIDLPGVFVLRDLVDTDRIKAAVDHHPGRVLIVGAGFIGLEMAENTRRLGLETTVVELQDQIMPPLDKEMTTPLERLLGEHGVELVLRDAVEAFEATTGGITARLKSGRRIEAGVVVLSIGVRPDNALALGAGLEVGPRGGIRVNAKMQTSDPDIYAVGDAVETIDFVTDERVQVPLAGPANRQGRIAADNALGRKSTFRGTQGTAIVGFFGMAAAMTGASEKTLVRLARPFRKVYVHPNNHASYYPGASALTLKLLFEPETGKILGAQCVGREGVDKRIDVIAMAIQAGLTVFDLEEAELAYAPQFGSAKDPVNMAGFVAAGLLRGDHPQTWSEELPTDETHPFILDVRTPTEFHAGHLPGAVNIPIEQLRARLGEVSRERPVVAYCKVGQRGYLATRILLEHGYSVRNLSGGYVTWEMVQAPK